jgi:two-component system, LytTR family, sensor kinase
MRAAVIHFFINNFEINLIFKPKSRNDMKKIAAYAPYIYTVLYTIITLIANNAAAFRSDVVSFLALYPLLIFGLWRVNEKLLSISDNLLVKWGSLVLGSSLYILVIIGLDYYVFHILVPFLGLSLKSFFANGFMLTFISVFVIEGIKWTNEREQSSIENLTLQAENMEAQFNLLVQQVNPDFLFHSLNTLQTMVKSDDPKAEEYILKLADVYRQTLKKGRNNASLEEELDFLQSYLFLMRYGQEAAITLDVNISEAALDYDLPVFSLQLLVENCIKHNAFSPIQPLHIKIFQKDTKSITVSNNYQPKASSTESSGVGIENLKLRYALVGVDDAVYVEQNETTYSTTIKLM